MTTNKDTVSSHILQSTGGDTYNTYDPIADWSLGGEEGISSLAQMFHVGVLDLYQGRLQKPACTLSTTNDLICTAWGMSDFLRLPKLRPRVCSWKLDKDDEGDGCVRLLDDQIEGGPLAQLQPLGSLLAYRSAGLCTWTDVVRQDQTLFGHSADKRLCDDLGSTNEDVAFMITCPMPQASC